MKLIFNGVKSILHKFGTCKIDFLYIGFYLAAKIDFTRKPILAAPVPPSVTQKVTWKDALFPHVVPTQVQCTPQ